MALPIKLMDIVFSLSFLNSPLITGFRPAWQRTQREVADPPPSSTRNRRGTDRSTSPTRHPRRTDRRQPNRPHQSSRVNYPLHRRDEQPPVADRDTSRHRAAAPRTTDRDTSLHLAAAPRTFDRQLNYRDDRDTSRHR